ncbi:MAG: isoprenyl transferase [Rhodothermia bacterium]|nr:isoprenyl transferase [Rhodothermia bacterium]
METEVIRLSKTEQTKEDRERQQLLKKQGEIPEHIAIIMDGNGRWAKKQGWKRVFGHREGINSVRDITEACAQLGVKYLTLYTFSTENWNRPQEEVRALMELLVNTIRKEVPVLDKNNIRVNTIGDQEALPPLARKEMDEAIEITQKNTGMMLTLALSYSGRQELVEATQKIAQKVVNGTLPPESINAEVISAHLYTALMPDPSLMIRTGGEMRVSNFLLWQIAYTEFFITETYWPDFRRAALYEAIAAFQQRDRRFGGVKN